MTPGPLDYIAAIASGISAAAAGFAVYYTYRAYRISTTQLADQRITIRAQLRAYLGVDSVAFDVAGHQDGSAAITCTVALRNFGATPARHVRHGIAATVTALPSSYAENEVPAIEAENSIVMPSATMLLRHFISVPASLMADVHAARKSLILVIRFSYQTEFGDTLGELAPFYTTGNLFKEGCMEHLWHGSLAGPGQKGGNKQ